jgi:hypothetical protein
VIADDDEVLQLNLIPSEPSYPDLDTRASLRPGKRGRGEKVWLPM